MSEPRSEKVKPAPITFTIFLPAPHVPFLRPNGSSFTIFLGKSAPIRPRAPPRRPPPCTAPKSSERFPVMFQACLSVKTCADTPSPSSSTGLVAVHHMPKNLASQASFLTPSCTSTGEFSGILHIYQYLLTVQLDALGSMRQVTQRSRGLNVGSRVSVR